MKTTINHSGIDQPQPRNQPTANAAAVAKAMKSQPSRASNGCGYSGCSAIPDALRQRHRYRAAGACTSSVARLVDQAILLDPRHHVAQLGADLLQIMLGGHAPQRL